MHAFHAVAAPDRSKQWMLLLGSLAAVLMANTCQAQNLLPQPRQSTWLAASNQELDGLRGGFDAGSGLTVSFGITRTVLLNGQVVTSTSFLVSDMGKLTSAQAQALGQQVSLQTQVVQNGPGNTAGTGASAAPLAIYIQNTLNNQSIRSETVIHAASSGLSLVKNLNLQATLNESINNAIRNR